MENIIGLENIINGHSLTSVDHHKDLGVMFDCYLNFHQHTSEVASKANRVLACMKRAFTDLNNDGFLKLYKAMVRPIIEYANTIWGPHFLLFKGDWKEYSITQLR